MTTHVLERDGVRLHYEVHGGVSAKAPLLLTHGYGASSAMWRGNLAALSGDRQVITWDIRGHGRTVTPAESARYTHEGCVADMAAILDACGATVAVIGGLSLGGYLALCFHLARAERVAALLLLCRVDSRGVRARRSGSACRQPRGEARCTRPCRSRSGCPRAPGAARCQCHTVAVIGGRADVRGRRSRRPAVSGSCRLHDSAHPRCCKVGDRRCRPRRQPRPTRHLQLCGQSVSGEARVRLCRTLS
jgi:pimeloyl-ACP methyl ester carboxylesterase